MTRCLNQKTKTGQKASKTPVKSNTKRQKKDIVSPSAPSQSSPPQDKNMEDNMSVDTDQHENGDEEPHFVDRK